MYFMQRKKLKITKTKLFETFFTESEYILFDSNAYVTITE